MLDTFLWFPWSTIQKSSPILDALARELGLWVYPRLPRGFLPFLLSSQNLLCRSRLFRWLQIVKKNREGWLLTLQGKFRSNYWCSVCQHEYFSFVFDGSLICLSWSMITSAFESALTVQFVLIISIIVKKLLAFPDRENLKISSCEI